MSVPFGVVGGLIWHGIVYKHTRIHAYIQIYLDIMILISYYGYEGAFGSLRLGKVQYIVGV